MKIRGGWKLNPISDEHRKKLAERSTIHGYFGTATYGSWRGMIDRCNNRNSASFKYYGARGISVCAQWANSFTAFLNDMGEKPNGKSLERIDNDGDYAPENCRWATAKEQANNRRTSKVVDVRGERLTAAQLAQRIGMKPQTVQQQLRRGWTVERIVANLQQPSK